MLTLKIEKRDIKTNLKEIREGDSIPAVFYGKKEESTPITISKVDFIKIWKESGISSLISLSGVDEDKEVIIHDMDIDPVSGQVLHIDFYVTEKGKLMEVEVPLEFVGVSPAVKSLGGILVKVMHEIKIEVLPKDIPQNIEVDISNLENLDSQISIKDLKLSEGVTVKGDSEEVVASISQAVEESEEAESIDIADIEIEKKGKKEEEEEGGDEKEGNK